MRKFLISLLLASAAAASPALADPNDGGHDFGDREAAHEARQQAHQERQQMHEQTRSEDSGRQAEVRNFGGNAPTAVRSSGGPSSDGQEHGRFFDGGNFGGGVQADVHTEHGSGDGGQRWHGRMVDQGGVLTSPMTDGPATQGGPPKPTNWRMHERQAGGVVFGQEGGSHDEQADEQTTGGHRSIEWRRVQTGGFVQPDHALPRVLQTRTPIVSNIPREGTQPPLRTELGRRTSVVQWNTNWRHDHRYNWWDWRRRHRSFFHLGFYYDPFGWDYRPYEIGWRLWPSYFSSRYWIRDPWEYRLPYAPPGYRWIRYYDDALLVDIWDGEVVDVIHDFFW